MTPQTDDAPIACTLGAGDFKARIAWIAALNTEALREVRRDDLTLHLVYASDASDRVRQMVAQERACCAFLRFELSETKDSIRLTITAPETARTAAETVFEPFQARRAPDPSAASACGCAGGAGC